MYIERERERERERKRERERERDRENKTNAHADIHTYIHKNIHTYIIHWPTFQNRRPPAFQVMLHTTMCIIGIAIIAFKCICSLVLNSTIVRRPSLAESTPSFPHSCVSAL
jgi:hypothetical protein